MSIDISACVIHDTWKTVLVDEFTKPYFSSLQTMLSQQEEAGYTIYPKTSEVFNAFNLTPFDKVRVVILGQDPYHGE